MLDKNKITSKNMELTHRNYMFILMMIYLLMHSFNIAIMEFHQKNINELLFSSCPGSVFIAVDILSVASIVVLLYGLLTFQQSVVLAWFVFLVIAWHFPFSMIIVNGIMVKFHNISTAHYFMGTLIPLLQLCVWSLTMIHTFRYWCCLKDFVKLPEYLRKAPRLLELSNHRYETDKLRKQILTSRRVESYQFRDW